MLVITMLKIKVAYNFTFEHFNGNKLKYKIFANSVRYIEKDSIYRLLKYYKRK